MSLLDSFILQFASEGLEKLNSGIEEANEGLDDFEENAQEAEESNEELNKSVLETIDSFKKLASSAMKTLAPFVMLGKAISEAAQFADQALEIADAAEKAGMSLEQFQLNDGNKYAIFTKEDVNNAKDYEMTMRDIRMGTASIGANIARMLLPAMTWLSKVAKQVVDFFTQHGEFIKLMFIGIAIAITVACIPAIIDMGVALWTALAPILPVLLAVVAYITALSLVIEDLIVWVNGGESAFGDLWTNIFGGTKEAKKMFDDLKKSFNEIWRAVKPVLEVLINVELKYLLFLLKSVAAVLGTIVKGISLLSGKKIDITANVKKVETDGSHADGLDYVPYDGYIAELHKGERVQTAEEAEEWRNGLMAAKRAINFTAQYPLNSIPQGSITNAYNNTSTQPTVNIGDITINTQATDAQGIALDLAGYIKQAVISLDDGMLA